LWWLCGGVGVVVGGVGGGGGGREVKQLNNPRGTSSINPYSLILSFI